jgi:SAM-dependent methyltransferase
LIGVPEMTDVETFPPCAVCGASEFQPRQVLWQALIDEWELRPDEAAYVDTQQGTVCRGCGSNVRSIALAAALCRSARFNGTLDAWIASSPRLSLLEINEAGTLHARLRQLPGHAFGAWPDVDLQALCFADGTFDRIVHSDTLEHVPDPLAALRQMHRVLRPDGAAVFTVPIIVARMTRSRTGLAPSYHGDPANATPDLLVHTEFGADAWALVLAAGFAACEFVAYAPPAGIAIIAWR